jgi:ABC-type transport system involved in multi-copper enzyme maturation permease subunit
MNLPTTIFLFGALIRETFRQALAARTFWLMLSVSAVCIVFCLGIGIDEGPPLQRPGEIELVGRDDQPLTGPNARPNRMSMAFGLVRVEIPRDGFAAVGFIQSLLAVWVAGTIGTLVTLIWTAGFLPSFLQPSAAAVMLAKPVPRWVLLTGKCTGVLVFVAFQMIVFFVGTWLALGLRTGIMPPEYLLAIPILLVHFAVIYSFSALIAVLTRSTAASIFGALVFWFCCYAMNYGRNAVVAMPYLDPEVPFAPALQHTAEAGYWILPKPGDMVVLLDETVKANQHFSVVPQVYRVAMDHGQFYGDWSLITSLLFAAVMLGVAAWQLRETDY